MCLVNLLFLLVGINALIKASVVSKFWCCTPITATCELRTDKKDFLFSVINLKWNTEVTAGWIQHSLTCAVAVELQTCLSSPVWGEKRREKGTYAHYLYASLISRGQIYPINNSVISLEGVHGYICYFIS